MKSYKIVFWTENQNGYPNYLETSVTQFPNDQTLVKVVLVEVEPNGGSHKLGSLDLSQPK